VTTIALFVSAESAMICAIYFRSIGKRWEYFEIVGLSMSLICLFSVCFIPESPRWLISRGKFKRAFDVYKQIAKFNGVLFTDMIYRLTRDQTTESVNKSIIANPNQYLVQKDEEEEIALDGEAEHSVPDIPFDQRIDKPRVLRDLVWGPKRKVLGVRFLVLLVLWCTYMYSYQVVEAFL
jgi:Sugar (and other) transporter